MLWCLVDFTWEKCKAKNISKSITNYTKRSVQTFLLSLSKLSRFVAIQNLFLDWVIPNLLTLEILEKTEIIFFFQFFQESTILFNLQNKDLFLISPSRSVSESPSVYKIAPKLLPIHSSQAIITCRLIMHILVCGYFTPVSYYKK